MKAIIGIDISKKDFAVALIIDQKPKKNKFSNAQSGFEALKKWLECQDITHAKACMEATGSYGERLADFLYYNDYEVSVLNPACIKAFAQSKLSRHKTDEIDAVLIAEYACMSTVMI
jgi:transposase